MASRPSKVATLMVGGLIPNPLFIQMVDLLSHSVSELIGEEKSSQNGSDIGDNVLVRAGLTEGLFPVWMGAMYNWAQIETGSNTQ